MSYVLEVTPEGLDVQRFPLTDQGRLVVGRTGESDLVVDSDPFISRRHFEIGLEGGHLAVRRLPGAPNPVIFEGKSRDEFRVATGGTFAIGRTQFVFLASLAVTQRGGSEHEPTLQNTMAEKDLYAEGDLDRLRLHDLLDLPAVLAARTPAEFRRHLAALLRAGTGARWAGIFTEEGRALAQDAGDGVAPGSSLSRSIAGAALAAAPRPTLYCWTRPGNDFAATMAEGIDWAICAAIHVPGEPPQLLYAAGEGGSAREQREASRFVGLIADIVGRHLSVRRLESWHERLRQFFSGPVVRQILDSADPAELAPRRATGTVMFFDLRAFSRRMEGDDALVLANVGQLMSVMTAMTRVIFREQGVVLSYVGDGIMACWNVPVADTAHVDHACRAALGMLTALRELPGGWSCGIGLHTGPVVAGAMGSAQVFSYGVLGRVVNEASRVEGLTKIVGCPILVTGAVAGAVSPAVAVPVRVGRFQPAGMTTSLDLFELVPAPGDPARAAMLARGLAAFERGDWDEADRALAALPAEDGPGRYLRGLVRGHRAQPPRHWAGVIELTEK